MLTRPAMIIDYALHTRSYEEILQDAIGEYMREEQFPVQHGLIALIEAAQGEPDPSESIATVTGDGDRGEVILNRIQEKAHIYMSNYGREAKYIILLDIIGYLRNSQQLYRGFPHPDNEETIHTSAGLLQIIVLPQAKKRIQISGDNMSTALQVLSRATEREQANE